MTRGERTLENMATAVPWGQGCNSERGVGRGSRGSELAVEDRTENELEAKETWERKQKTRWAR